MFRDNKILRKEGLGLLTTFIAVNLVIILNNTSLQIYNPSVILIATIVFSTFYGTVRSGLLSSALSLFFLLVYLSSPDVIFTYESQSKSSLIVLFIVIPLIVVMVSMLKKRLQDKSEELDIQLKEALKTEGELKLFVKLLSAINTSRDIKTALEHTIRNICETTHWALADAWMYNPDAGTMDFMTAYQSKLNKNHGNFIRQSGGYSFRRGEGLPGMAWEKNNMVFLRNFSRELYLPRAASAKIAGIKSAIGIPVPLKGEVIAILCFYLDDIWDRDKKFLELITAVAGQLGALLDKKQNEQAVYESELKFRSITETTPEAIIIINSSGDIVYLNPGAEQMFGYQREDMINQPITMLMNEKDAELHNKGMERYLKNRVTKLIGKVTEVKGLRKSGESFPIELALGTWESGNEVYFSSIMRDITERKYVQEQLQKLNEELESRVVERTIELGRTNKKLSNEIHIRRKAEEALRIKNDELLKTNADLDRFVYTASHDLKVPVTNMEGLISNLKEISDTSNEDSNLIIEMMERSVIQLKQTIVDLTEIIKVQKQERHEEEWINVYNLVEDVKSSIQKLINSENANIHVDTTKYPEIKFSKVNLRSILYNLITNAIKYRHPDRKAVVKITTEKQNEYALLTVEDNGLGLDKNQIEKIFSMFKRVHDHVEGSGIGLYIVKRIVDDNKGKIEVESRVNEGSRFKIYLKN